MVFGPKEDLEKSGYQFSGIQTQDSPKPRLLAAPFDILRMLLENLGRKLALN